MSDKREIRFRVWDGEKMLSPDYIDRGGTACWTENGIPERGGTVMQFTGLRDKAGKDIYEGDIVRCSSGCPHIMEWRQELGGKYIGGMPGWYLSGLLSGGGEGYAWTGAEEIIGNIYDHPELLP